MADSDRRIRRLTRTWLHRGSWIAVIIVAALVFFGRGAHTVLPGGEPTLAEKIGQMVMVGFRGTAVSDTSMIELREQIKDGAVGGVAWYDYNVVSPGQVKKLNRTFDKLSKRPLFIAVDEEGGNVARLGADKGFADYPSAEAAAAMGIEDARTRWRDMAETLADHGFTVNFAPVVDVNVAPESPAIGALGRSFSDDPAAVVKYASAFISAMRAEHIVPVIKHFPGHGSAAADSHEGITDVTGTWSEKELIPFARLIDEGNAHAVMTAHVMHTGRDEALPASLSPMFVSELLRERMDFTGVVFTDDLQMGAVAEHFDFETIVLSAVESGSDVLVFSNYFTFDPRIPWKVRDILLKAVADGRISESRIDESYRRIMGLKGHR